MAKYKVRTLSELATAIDDELSWRKRELNYLKTAIKKNTSNAQLTYIRASTTLLYAHWEGFVVACLRIYMQYVEFQRNPLVKLVPSIRVGAVISQIKRMEREEASTARSDFLEAYEILLPKTVELKGSSIINAESNLNSSRFLGMVSCAGIDITYFKTASKFLDESLIARRNSICHGEFEDLDFATYHSVETKVVDLMERVKDHALDSAQNRKFLLP